jgi:hypothetical protein
MLKKAVVSAADWYGTAPTAPFLRFVDAVASVAVAAVPVVFWLNVGHVKVPVEKSPDAGVANTAPVFKSSAKRAFAAVVAVAALPVVFWLNVGQPNTPVVKSPDAGVANTAPVFKSSAVAALPVVFWFHVGTVPVRPEYGTLKAVVATGGTAGGADVQSVPSDVKSCPATPGVGNVVDADAVVCVVLSGNTIPRLLICVVI